MARLELERGPGCAGDPAISTANDGSVLNVDDESKEKLSKTKDRL
jgi:hypothetical protein